MEFKVGQKYRIVDIDAWWDNRGFNSIGRFEGNLFKNEDIVVVSYNYDDGLSFFLVDSSLNSHTIEALTKNDKWHGSCIELITDDESEQSDDTISIYHIADVLEDACINTDVESISSTVQLLGVIETCIKSLRKAGY